jgi:hypothetical protein
LNGPALFSLESSESSVTDGSTITLRGNVVDAPGVIDSISVVSLNQLNLPFGDINITESSIGQMNGNIEIQITFPENEAANVNISVAVFDGQNPRKSDAKSVSVTVFCPSDLAGDYSSVSSGVFGNGGPAYNGIESTVTLTAVDGTSYNVDDMSFGLYPVGYVDDAPPGILDDNCNTIVGDPGNLDQYSDPFTINGTVNADGTINISWSNTFGDTGDVVLTPI